MAKSKPLYAGPAAPLPDITPVADPFGDAEVQPAAPRPPALKFADSPTIPAASGSDVVAALQAQVAALAAKLDVLSQQASASPVTHAAELDKQMREYAEKCGRPLDVRVQEIADARYPSGRGRYEVWLDDKNGQPRLRLRAETEADAVGRYQDVCGLLSFDRTKITVTPLAA